MKTARYWELIHTQALALQAAEHVGDLTAISYSLQARVMAMTPLHMYDSVIADLNRSVEICRATGDRFYEARGLCKIGATWCLRHDYAAGLEHALLALEASRSLGVEGRTEQARSLNLIGWSRAHLGDLDQAVEDCEESVRLAEELDDLWSQAVALDSLAFAHREAGAHEMSAATYRRALAVHDRYGAAPFRAQTQTHLADLLVAMGEVDEALTLYREASEILEATDEQSAEQIRQRIGELEATREP